MHKTLFRKLFVCFPGLPPDILPAVRPELIGVDSGSENNANNKDLEDEDVTLETDDDDDRQSPVDDGVLVADEERRSGVVRLSVYWTYWTAVGRCLATLVLLSILLMQGLTSSILLCVSVKSGVCSLFCIGIKNSIVSMGQLVFR